MLTRDAGLVIQADSQSNVYDCNTGDGGSTSGGAINGDIVDRLALGRNWRGAQPFCIGEGLTSTAASKKLTLTSKLQHGASSGGGDMADYSTGQQLGGYIFNTSAESTEFLRWSTGVTRVYSHAPVYDINGAKRFLRTVATVTMPGNTTSTAAGGQVAVAQGINFFGGDEAPQKSTAAVLPNGHLATATATA